ncbi:Maf family protein [Kangiella koreensis]|uniref:dTTP/UTP pyrophosphatase n=1 Tax=Kangiella koreensis (strain DSM 16069 / JCM 12317 / KCTC 12182 / SW-125) TaxID=523791 RepID=C7R9G5_KANKD|nr:Maf family protein [Kangiella koreensis]ACV26056.1 maf protein [Kangiella koreensis DSM 16069]
MFEQIYLASASPRRKELLTQLGVSFIQVANDFDETPLVNESAEDYVTRLAIGKARSAQPFCDPDNPLPILGADTIVVLNGQFLGKPADLDEAKSMLKQLSGRTHQVYSGVSLCYQDKTIWQVSKSDVTFSQLTEQTVDAYCATKEPLGKAGSYAIQGIAGSLVNGINGSYSGIVGLPLYETRILLEQMQIRHLLSPQLSPQQSPG